MSEVGKKFEAGEYYIPDMLASAESVGAAMEILKPYLASSGVQSNGTVLMATVKGDLHDIGKNIVSVMLRGIGYTSPTWVMTSKQYDCGSCSGPATTIPGAIRPADQYDAANGHVIKALEAVKLRESVKVIVGGAPVSEEFAQKIKADGYGADAFQAVTVSGL
jgi:5-methyltetrahydrofolate--homocysteine methyltransferase